MKFDENHAIHLEKVERNYLHLDTLIRINEEDFPEKERLLFDEILNGKIIFGGVEALEVTADREPSHVFAL